MIKMLLYAFLFIILLSVLFNLTISDIGGDIEQKKKRIEEHVGKKYLINKDTVFITDYNFLKQSYIDDKGRTYSFALIRNTKPLKE